MRGRKYRNKRPKHDVAQRVITLKGKNDALDSEPEEPPEGHESRCKASRKTHAHETWKTFEREVFWSCAIRG
jgi:hypothetical protein